MYGTLAAAYDRKTRVVEYGIGGHRAKALRGCQPRDVTSCLLTPTTSTSATLHFSRRDQRPPPARRVRQPLSGHSNVAETPTTSLFFFEPDAFYGNV